MKTCFLCHRNGAADPLEKELPEPPSWMVGPKEGESIEEVYEKAMSELE